MATGVKQGFRWFCEGCNDEVSRLLKGGDVSVGLGDSIRDTVATVVTETFEKFQQEILGRLEIMERKIDSPEVGCTHDSVSQPEAFADIVKKAIKDSREGQRQYTETPVKVNAFGRDMTVRDQQVLVVKPKEGTVIDENKITSTNNTIEGALSTVPVNSFRKSKTGTFVMKFPSRETKLEAINLISPSLGNDSDFIVSEPKKMLPKMTIAGIPSAVPDDEVIDMVVKKNKEIGDLVGNGHMFTLNFTKDKGNYKYAVIKMSPEIRAVIEKKDYYVYVGMNRCKAYDRFWVTQCYHCQKFGHIASKCPKKDESPTCAGEHESRACTNKSSPKCINCSSLETPAESICHFASSKTCPLMVSQQQKIIENTDLSPSKNL